MTAALALLALAGAVLAVPIGSSGVAAARVQSVSFVGTNGLCECSCAIGGGTCSASGTVCYCVRNLVTDRCMCEAYDPVAAE